MSEYLLEVNNLRAVFQLEGCQLSAVDGISFAVRKGETLGLVGESGCGKSVTALSLLRLIPDPPGKVAADQVLFDQVDLFKLSNEEMRRIRGNKISMIFQEPMTALNPVYPIGVQVAESLRLHLKLNKKEALERTIELLKTVGIPLPERRVNEYPHQLSGGMRQRVVIAMALACNPKLLIADEPTTALDVTIQAQILELMKKLKEEHDASIILITHDLGVVAEIVDRVIVMYAGRIVEIADVNILFEEHLHPYTEGLLLSIPHLETNLKRLRVIDGSVPTAQDMPEGCKFHPRCKYVMAECKVEEPELLEVSAGHFCRCWKTASWGEQSGKY